MEESGSIANIRYIATTSLYARHLELILGGSTHHLQRLGKLIAEAAA